MGGRLPEEKLIQECVDSIGTLHHDHVTTVLQDLQEGHKEDLKENAKQSRELDFGIINIFCIRALVSGLWPITF